MFTEGQGIVSYQYSVTTILLVVTPISFLRKVILYHFTEDKLHLAIREAAFITLLCARCIPQYKLKEPLLFYHQFVQYRQESFYLAALHLIIKEVYIIEEVVSLVFGHITTITAGDNRYGG